MKQVLAAADRDRSARHAAVIRA